MSSSWSPFAEAIRLQKYAHTLPSGHKESWAQTAHRVATCVMGAIKAPSSLTQAIERAITARKFIPGGRYLYAAGRPLHQTQNCLLTRVEDSREGWAEHLHKYAMGLMSGAGMGTVYSDVRPEGAHIRGMGGRSTGPLALMRMTNECGRGIMQGGSRRSAVWAGLHWSHADAPEFIRMKDWPEHITAAKARDFNAYAPMDMTNISVILDTEFFNAIKDTTHPRHRLAYKMYWDSVEHMCRTGEPGFSVDAWEHEGENLRNACTEVTSRDDSDICNLGSINLARVESLDEMYELTEIATAFLLAGTVYSDVPYPKVAQVREKNRRLGLGLMGIHEWLLARGYKYGPCKELVGYLEVWKENSFPINYAQDWGLSEPVKTRAIAPTGSIGILGETTTGIEPIFCTAYKRRYLEGTQWKYQYVVDPTAQRLIEGGISPDAIEDATVLAEDVERRLAFQAWVQGWVDHGISSTINLPAWGSSGNCEGTLRTFGQTLLKYLPQLRGVTVYPDGARSGQPLNPVKYETAMRHPGEVFVEAADLCDLTKGGSCGA